MSESLFKVDICSEPPDIVYIRVVVRHTRNYLRQISRTARHLQRLGERLNLDGYQALARQMDESAEKIVLVTVFNQD